MQETSAGTASILQFVRTSKRNSENRLEKRWRVARQEEPGGDVSSVAQTLSVSRNTGAFYTRV